ncbi:glycerate kinase type-2 family protein [Comamonas composti]|uniref:glycerate kinase type-2 family protein n=1 Tax=Comamonas composti TaxID=408558 RepID=UPI000425030A|nr:glycerate kinase [Comamonas composti]
MQVQKSASGTRQPAWQASSVRDDPAGFLRHLFQVAVDQASPAQGLARHLPQPPKGRTLVLGAGKAAASMAQALEALWPADAPLSGLVVTRYGHVPPREPHVRQHIDVLEAAHPVPDAAGLGAAQRMLELAQGLGADDLVLCLISGGGSALLSLPAEGMSLEHKQAVNQALLASGASIAQMNCVRKHLSRIKGGRLAAACHPARVLTLAISDVPGDDPSIIASGPTVADASTCEEALTILQRYGIALPDKVHAALQAGQLETPKPGDARLAGHELQLIATPMQSLKAAAAAARSAGLAAYILSDAIEGESREIGKMHAALARSAACEQACADLGFIRPCVLLSGGETTVTLKPVAPGRPAGRGGRAGEFCLGLAQALQGQPGVWGLAADTDGMDGVEDNAGASVRPDTLARARALGLDVAEHLDRNNAYDFFEALGDLVITGPTHTNVNDFRAILIL